MTPVLAGGPGPGGCSSILPCVPRASVQQTPRTASQPPLREAPSATGRIAPPPLSRPRAAFTGAARPAPGRPGRRVAAASKRIGRSRAPRAARAHGPCCCASQRRPLRVPRCRARCRDASATTSVSGATLQNGRPPRPVSCSRGNPDSAFLFGPRQRNLIFSTEGAGPTWSDPPWAR